MSGPAALVTGGSGFVGRRLVLRLLDQGRRVTVFGRTPAPDLEARGARFIRGSIEDPASVEAACAEAETVFHVAAKVGVWGRRSDFFRVNVTGTRNVIAGCLKHGVRRLVATSTPSVVYNGRGLAGADESLPLTRRCPSPYPLTKAMAERDVLAADGPSLRTVALRPHLVWGPGDPHLIPTVVARARAGRLRIVGSGANKVDLVHVENAIDAHLLAEAAAERCGGRAYFITNGEPVMLWEWINELLRGLGIPEVRRKAPLWAASAAGALCEACWRALPLRGEPPMTRFVAAELARDHWFDLGAARRDLGYAPRISMAEGTRDLLARMLTGRAA